MAGSAATEHAPRAGMNLARGRMMPLGRRCLVALVLVLATACSHTRPFVRGPRAAAPQIAALDHRLILIGDAGDPDRAREPALDLLARRVRRDPAKTTVVFLGDNVYETGMPEPTELEGSAAEMVLDEVLLGLFAGRRDAERRLKAQVKSVREPGVRAIFVPGNHDWGQGLPGDGWKRVRQEQAYIDGMRRTVTEIDLALLPRDGCPGPAVLDLGRHARLVALDTQWWLEAGPKPSPADPGGCPVVTADAVRVTLERELEAAAAAGRRAVVVGHHPLHSRGPHGGFVPWIEQVFPFHMAPGYVPFFVEWIPLPGLGTAIAWWRAHRSPSSQDFSGPRNAEFRRALRTAMERAAERGAPAFVYAAGHDHSLQVFRPRRGPRWSLVSGLGSRDKGSGVSHGRATLFAHSDRAAPGLMEIDFLANGTARLAVVEWSPEAEGGVEVYSADLTRGMPWQTKRHATSARADRP